MIVNGSLLAFRFSVRLDRTRVVELREGRRAAILRLLTTDDFLTPIVVRAVLGDDEDCFVLLHHFSFEDWQNTKFMDRELVEGARSLFNNHYVYC